MEGDAKTESLKMNKSEKELKWGIGKEKGVVLPGITGPVSGMMLLLVK